MSIQSIKQRFGVIGNSRRLNRAIDIAIQVSPTDLSVLITGESGTGKETIPQIIHHLSPRKHNSYIAVNCGAIPEGTIDSELFGHEPGAFTGATRAHQGRFERAEGGTLLLDELGTMSLRLQEKLLRLIEYGEFERLGGQQTLYVDVRIVAATNTDLVDRAQRGLFREDLLDRLSFDVVHLPPLRFRPEDIEPLAQHFALKICREINWDYFAGFSKRALQQLQQHSWPGNIRELKNVVERSVYRWSNPKSKVDSIIVDPFDSPYRSAPPATAPPDPSPDSGHTSIERLSAAKPAPQNLSFAEQTAEFEIQLLRRALEKNHSHQGLTATALGLSYHQLRGLLRKHSLIGNDREQN